VNELPASPAGGDQAENLLGALGLAVADRLQGRLAVDAGQGPTGAAALSALDQFLRDPSIDLLRQVLGLTSSGTVRLVDRLAEAALVERADGPDRRSTVVALTPAGRRAAQRVTAARQHVLADALGVLSPTERRQFAALAGRVLVGLAGAPGGSGWMCRLCDLAACGRPAGRCPVAGPNPPSF
jgi:DNA-binding MarR family transcriptional regulator